MNSLWITEKGGPAPDLGEFFGMNDLQKAAYQALYEFGSQGIFTTDEHLVVTSWNRWLEEHTGYPAKKVAGARLFDLFPELVERKLDRFYKAALQGMVQVLSQRFHHYLLPIPAQMGSGFERMQQSARIAPLYIHGEVAGTITMIEDVTERLVREQELLHELSLQQTLFDIDRAILNLDLNLCLSKVVDQITRLAKVETAAVVLIEDGKPMLRACVCSKGDLNKPPSDMGKTIAGKAIGERKEIFLRHENRFAQPGMPLPLHSESRSAVAVPLQMGNEVIGALVAESSQKNAFTEWERRILTTLSMQTCVAIRNARLYTALQESENRYRTLTENSFIGVCLIHDDRLLYSNQAFAKTFGFSANELLGMRTSDLVHPHDRAMHTANLRRLLSGEKNELHYRFRASHKDGSIIHVEVYGKRIQYEGRPVLLATFLDITEQVRAREEQARLATAIEHAAESVFISDTDWNILYVNPAFEAMSGYSRQEIVGKHARILKSGEHDATFYKNMQQAILEKGLWSGRFSSRRKDGEIRQIEAKVSAVRNENGDVVNFVAIERDITDEILLQAQLRQAQKMEAIGTLAGGIAHDFNNILGAILGYAELTELDTDNKEMVRENVRQIIRAAERAKDLVKQILTFSRKSEEQFRPLAIGSVVKEALKMLRASIPSTIEIRTDIALSSSDGIGIVRADPTQIHQILLNLCTNAAHAMRETGGVLEVTLSAVDIAAPQQSSFAPIKPGSYVKLVVRDTGEGMHEETLERIFDPYFTTKSPGEGSGLGLTVVHGIVRNHNGFIDVRSQPGKGTEFSIYLPRIQSIKAEEQKPSEPLMHGRERILFIDDEPSLTKMWGKILSNLGYQVVCKTSSLEALEAFREAPQSFDLVVTDQTMPHMTGAALAQEMLRIRPDIPIILCTGHSDLINAGKAAELGIREFIMKPLSLRPFSVAIRRVLEGRS